MVTIITVPSAETYSPPANATVNLTKQVALTNLPIPTLDIPYVMNFGGATINLTITWVTAAIADVNELYSYFASATSATSYQIQIPEWTASGNSTFTLNGFAEQMQITQQPGQLVWNVTLTFSIGNAIQT